MNMFRVWQVSSLLLVLLTTTAFSHTAVDEPKVLARVGDSAPGGGTYRSLYPPQINESGVIAFLASVDYGAEGDRFEWFLVDTFDSMQPILALSVGPSPDGLGLMNPSTAWLRKHGRELDFHGILDSPAPLTSNHGWFVREEDGTIVERLRRGRPIAAGLPNGPQIVCFYSLYRHPEGSWIVKTVLVDTVDDCQVSGDYGPQSDYRIATDHTVERLVGEGDAIEALAGGSLGPSFGFHSTVTSDRFGSIWYEDGPPPQHGLFRLGTHGPELEVADGDTLHGIGKIQLGPSNLRHIGPQGYLGWARVQVGLDQPLRKAILRFDSSGGSVLLEAGQTVPDFGSIAELLEQSARVGNAVGLQVWLGDNADEITGSGVLAIETDGQIKRGARTGHPIPGAGSVHQVGQIGVLESGAVVHVASFDENASSPRALVLAGEGGPSLLLPLTLEIDGTVYKFELPVGSQAPRWPINSRGQIAALALPTTFPNLDGLIVYFGSSIFADGFESP